MRTRVLAAAVALVVGVPGLAGSVATSGPVLPAPVGPGRAELLLGDRIDAAARLNEMSTARLRALLDEDPTTFVDGRGRLGFVEPAVAAPASLVPEPSASAPYPLTSTFALHSKPGSDRTVHLDFDGADLSGTAWESTWRLTSWWPSDGAFTGYNAEGSPATFSDYERQAIQQIWQEVSEDFAPFDVDVTTQAPPPGAIERSTSSDQVYGTSVLISTDPRLNDNNGGSGVAYIGVFDAVGSEHTRYQPALVFTDGASGVPHWIAQTASHEIGHNLGLQHDGILLGTGYYSGIGGGLWAPIMGASFNNPVSQWSKGEYSLAGNPQDDFAVMRTNGAPARADEAGQTPETARSLAGLSGGVGYIASAADQDWYVVTCEAGSLLTATATVAPRGANLDVRLALRDATGELTASDPAATRVNNLVATGLSAAVSHTVPSSGDYYLVVDGVGARTWATGGYSDYGSVGAYTLAQSNCTEPADVLPPPTATVTVAPAPSDVVAEPGRKGGKRSAKVRWAAPAGAGASVTAYVVRASKDGGGRARARVPATTRAVTMRLDKGRWRFNVRAVNEAGRGPWSAASGPVRAR